MSRREFITLLGGAAAWPLAARAQQAGFARVGVLGPDLNNPVTGPGYQVFLSELRKLGFTEGQNLVVEYRRTDEGLQRPNFAVLHNPAHTAMMCSVEPGQGNDTALQSRPRTS